MTVSFHTLGCKLNFAETATIGRLFADNGYARVPFGEPADVVVVNSCTVTAQADKKCRQAIRKAVKTSPDALVVVVGCFAELQAGEIARIPGVSMVLGNRDKFNIMEHIRRLRGEDVRTYGCDAVREFFASSSLFDRTRSFLKVQDGCDYQCTYCTIPKARGNSRNAPVADIVAQARFIAAQGVREIVLTGVNIGDFGRSTGESFCRLLAELDAVDGLERIRTGSVEPNLVTEEMIRLMARSDKLAPHFHIPLQSGCNRILRLMARRYRRELFAEKVALIRQYIPHAAIGADVIAGFPGETDDDFNDTLSFIEGLDLSYLHVFTYSERPETKAAAMTGKVNGSIAAQRSKTLIGLSDRKRKQFHAGHVGQTASVLFERRERGGSMSGFTGNYIRTEAPYDAGCIGKCTAVRITGVNDEGQLTAETIKDAHF
ncbi:MAG: tRNA (N(6)-L-threonylcarbamoyladenosine(37)-C(2))-methylthiotransferase MtaB [Bacteroidales bacterium]|jgi:threonylcarbamoyladenosine tRNA methylthiotransferase MtaB|nr:tRNA (N(6)-L-threonylcarbamoyladenosine(37)-C(2))-methylthiotransferase MtaB [Bacteroidales bacterium]